MRKYYVEDQQKPFKVELEAKDLRLGNWVAEQDHEGKVYYIQMTIDFLDALEVEPGLFDPIPLTPEILVKVHDDLKQNDIELRYDEGKYNVSFAGQWLRRLEYVHEFQNLFFALIGQELKIQL